VKFFHPVNSYTEKDPRSPVALEDRDRE
jgi:hypothetical protein